MWRIVLMSLAVGCGPTTTYREPTFSCRTPCGASIIAQNGYPVFSCDEYALVESLLVGEIADQFPDACRSFQGVTIWEMPGWSTTTISGEYSGWTECWFARAFFHVNEGFVDKEKTNPNLPLGHTAYAHELIHLAQQCNAPLPIDPAPTPELPPMDVAHANWYRAGLAQAVWNVANATTR